ncbi:hypothetical protein A4X13_0g2452 [Tilletia indica]|uniref:Uncharacterized protein n=1 Tax=Tilletia indica TaxID=43049 RepID=A0A177THY4_9BASI|nr:hypothetical protein A4X13_0g2452 [Tilletia indica]
MSTSFHRSWEYNNSGAGGGDSSSSSGGGGGGSGSVDVGGSQVQAHHRITHHHAPNTPSLPYLDDVRRSPQDIALTLKTSPIELSSETLLSPSFSAPSASGFLHPRRLARKAAGAFQSLAHSLSPRSASASSSTPLSANPYKALSTSPYSPSYRHRSGSDGSSPHQRQHYHLPRRRGSTAPFSPWTFSARTRWLFLAFLLLAIAFITGVTKLIIYILDPDKEPKTWQYFCTSQEDFPHPLADSLAPVDVFVGVFSIDSSYERRQLIRSTYATHTLPHDVHTGAQLANVQVKFILGRPRKLHARRVALEMEAYNDMVVLDMEENMNQGKTYAYFRWASENATVPILLSQEPGPTSEASAPLKTVVGWKKADYVVKADDDAFIVLSELERHLRVSPRKGTYWGYLIRDWFMGGECYALSNDLVQYIATSPDVVRYTHGKEDKKVAQWMNLHPNATNLNWVSERCWIYDGPKAGTAYSHGYLFPDYVSKLKQHAAKEAALEAEISAASGDDSQGTSSTNGLVSGPPRSAEWRRQHSASTVSKWKQPYVVPRAGMTVEEEVEALVEGGGRWDGFWVRPARVATDPFAHDAYHAGLAPILTSSSSAAALGATLPLAGHDYAAAEEDLGQAPTVWVPFSSLVYEANDPRLRPATDQAEVPLFRADLESDSSSGLALYNLSDSAQTSSRVQSPGSPPLLKRASIERVDPARVDGTDTASDGTHDTPRRRIDEVHPARRAQHLIPSRYVPLTTGGRRPALAWADPSKAPHLDQPQDSSRYFEGPAEMMQRGNLSPEQRLRARRYLYRAHGGTVVVHFLKKSEWFLETAIALLGKDVLWPEPSAGAAMTGAGPAALGGRAREWRMWGSPTVAPGPTDKEARIL